MLIPLILKKYWIFYKKLLKYKKKPTIKKAEKLSNQFDKLFNTQTGYENLDDRIAKTKAKKNELLLVLKYPNIPLHNNAAELAERAHVRQRDVSLHTITKDGTDAKDSSKRHLKEKDLKNHLESKPLKDRREKDNPKEPNESLEDVPQLQTLLLEKLHKDNQAMRALEILISYEIFKDINNG